MFNDEDLIMNHKETRRLENEKERKPKENRITNCKKTTFNNFVSVNLL
jgi:hypothetical protein